MKVIIIDDEPLARVLIREYLQDHSHIEVLRECNDGFEGIKSIQELRPDLIFLDIQMPKLNGFEMLELIEHHPRIIFTTAFDEYALKAFEANALDYLLKPFSKERFDKAIKKCIENKNPAPAYGNLQAEENYPESGRRIVLKTNGQIKILPVSEVMYMESYDDYVKIYTSEACYVKKKTMAFYEKNLNRSEFVRIHRTHILNLSFLTRIDQNERDSYVAVLKNGTNLPVSRNGYSLLKEQLSL